MSDDNYTPVGQRLDSIMERVQAEREAWPIWKKAYMQFRWKIAQPVRRFPREVRWFVQRGRRGWSDYDLWGMDGHIARVNIEMLAELRRVAHGYPTGLTRGDEEAWLTDDDRARRWPEIQAIDAQIGFEGGPNDGFERWCAMLAYFEEGWRGALSEIEDFDESGREHFKAMLPLYGEWFGGLWD